jgi:protein BCP1
VSQSSRRTCSQYAKRKGIKDDLRVLLGEQAHNVVLLVSQQVVNLRHQLFPPFYDAVFDEVSGL